jgi:hypothetical protein
MRQLIQKKIACPYHKIRGDDEAARCAAHNTLEMAVELLAETL